jgi:hypothetical protein
MATAEATFQLPYQIVKRLSRHFDHETPDQRVVPPE